MGNSRYKTTEPESEAKELFFKQLDGVYEVTVLPEAAKASGSWCVNWREYPVPKAMKEDGEPTRHTAAKQDFAPTDYETHADF